MSRIDLSHVSLGRIPWRPFLQLRRPSVPKPPVAQPPRSLAEAARTAEPPLWLSPAQQEEARRQLYGFCAWLDARLAKPARFHDEGTGRRRVFVFQAIAFTIDARRGRIGFGSIRNGRYHPARPDFEVGRPLTSEGWLEPVLNHARIADARQPELFNDAYSVNDIADWVARTAGRLLERNPAFREFRRHTLPRMFGIPSDIQRMALAARARPCGPMMHSRELNAVWRNQNIFRQVERENPHLLPLLAAFVECHPPTQPLQTRDPVLLLKDWFRDRGISEAAWRYVVRHGSRLFKVAWKVSAGQPPLEVAVRYLEALQVAGLPPPPPPSVVRVFLHGYNSHRDDAVRVGQHFHYLVDPAALGAGFLEADRRRQSGSVEGFAEEFMSVCAWSEGLDCYLIRNRAQTNWRWFLRRSRDAEVERSLLQQTEPRRWLTRLNRFRTGRMTVVAIDSAHELVRESLAMRNCLRNCIEECASGTTEIYSVRDAESGRRKGCIGVRYDVTVQPPHLEGAG